MRRFTIGIVDDLFYSLQSRLANDGHDVLVYMGSSNEIENFDVCKHKAGTISQASSLNEIYNKCDFVICGTANYNDIPAYEYFKNLNFPVIGHSMAATLLESDRDFARIVNEKLGITEFISNPNSHLFTNVDDAIEFLESTHDSWVLKQSPMSPQHIQENRTWVSKVNNHKSTISLLQGKNAWFYPEGNGGVILEQYIDGQEVCFGAWFDGEKFISPMYSCIEHKGAQNFDRGSMLTGEVGSTMNLHSISQNTIMGKVFDLLAPYLRGKCNGMIDMNVIIAHDTHKLNFVEYTIRYGRPTLEVQLSMLTTEDYGKVLFDLAQQKVDSDYLENHYQMDKYATAVTVFSYGIPFIRQHDAKVESPTALSLAFDMPSIPSLVQNNKVVLQQLFCRYSNDIDEGGWHTAPSERQFVVVGLSNTIDGSIDAAYKSLKGYNLPTCTWRDDVGATFAATENLLSWERIV